MTGQPEGMIEQQSEADGALVAQAVAGDAEAFRGLVERHQDRIVALLRRLSGCPEQAIDLAQETFLAAHRHLASFRQESRFSTWLHAIAVNQARAAARRRRPVASLDAVGADGRSRLAEPAAPEVSVWALDLLDDRFREVVVLADMQDASYEEIAATLEIPIGTVRSRLHRGRTELRMILAES